MAIPTIRKPTVAPNRAMARDVYPVVADQWAASIGPFTEDLIVAINWMGQQVTDVTDYKDQAAASAKAAAKSVEDAAVQVKLATDQAVASKGWADNAKGYRDSAQVSAQAAQAAAGLPASKMPGAVLRQMLDGSGGVEWWNIIVTQVGDTLVSTQAPDSNWVPTGRAYNKALYPQLFAKLGSIADWPASGATVSGQALSGYNFTTFAVGNGVSVAISTSNTYVSNDYFATGTLYANQLDNYQWMDLEFCFNKFFATPSNASGVRSSSSGISWSAVTGAITGGTNFRLRFGSGLLLQTQGNTTNAAISTDGNSFFTRTLPFTIGVQRPAYGKGLFVALSTTFVIWTSPDGVNWTNRGAMPFTSSNSSIYIAVADSGFMIIEQGTGNCAFSPDGITWARAVNCPLPSGSGTSISGGPGGFVVQQGGSSIYCTTVDGSKWVQRTLGVSTTFSNAVYVPALKSHLFLSSTSGSNVVRVKPYSYDPDAQFLTTEPIATPQGLNQYIRAS